MAIITEPEGIVGRKIVGIRPMNDEEAEYYGWDGYTPTVVELDDGAILFASRDEEGNGGGALFGHAADGEDFIILSQEAVRLAGFPSQG